MNNMRALISTVIAIMIVPFTLNQINELAENVRWSDHPLYSAIIAVLTIVVMAVAINKFLKVKT